MDAETTKILAETQSIDAKRQLVIFEACKNFKYSERCLMHNTMETFSYSTIMKNSRFCLIIKSSGTNNSNQIAQMSLFDSLKFNCIPVIINDEWILPFSEFIDWQLISIQINKNNIKSMYEILDKYSDEHLDMMLDQLSLIYEKYFSSIKAITLSIIDLLESRINPTFKKVKSLDYYEKSHEMTIFS